MVPSALILGNGTTKGANLLPGQPTVEIPAEIQPLFR